MLLDIWAKCNEPDSVYYDITWTGVIGTPSDKQREIFEIVRDARDVGIHAVKQAFEAKQKIHGWEVDQAVREFINGKGYGQYFIHRTGHSIGPTFTVMAPTLIIWKPRTIARSCPIPVSRSSPAFTCRSSECAAKST